MSEQIVRRPYLWKTDEYQTQAEARKIPQQADVQAYSAGALAYQPPGFMSGSYRCPNCMSEFLPRLERRISTAGWIVFTLLLVFIFPLFWIGLLIKEDVHVCPACRTKFD